MKDIIRMWIIYHWSPAQAAFLREARESDSDWSEVVDALNVALRATDKSE